MIEKEDRMILNSLLHASGPLTSESLSIQTSMSSKTIRRRLKGLSDVVAEHGATIVAKKGIGISLTIQDQVSFDAFRKSDLSDYDSHVSDTSHLRNLITLLLSQNDYQRADDLAERLFVSKSKLTTMLNEIRDIVAQYDLSVVSKPYYGLKIEGDEFNFRRFIASYYAQIFPYDDVSVKKEMQLPYVNEHRYLEIQSIVEEELEKLQYSMQLNVVSSLVIHLYVLISRLKDGMSIAWQTELVSSDSTTLEHTLAKGIIQQLESHFKISIPKDEYDYLLLHLLSKKTMEITDSNKIPDEINNLVEKVLWRIKENTNIDLINDLDLRIMLGLHLVPLMSRLQYHMELKNPILEDVRTRCVAAYDLAIICAHVIEDEVQVEVSQHEVSYFALHFDVALNRNSENIRKKNILVVCASGRASAQLLKIKFKQHFSNYMKMIEVCDVNEAQAQIDRGNFDYIFTTIPQTFDTVIPTFEFQFFLNHDDVEKIRMVLHNDICYSQIIQYFRPDMFLGVQSCNTKEEALSYMVKSLQKVEELPENFEALIMQRESICGTDIMPSVALPHPNQVITKDTFISVLLLKKPIVWDRNKVRMVFMISISREDSEKYKFLFEWIIDLFSNPIAIQHILQEGTYESLQHELMLLNDAKENT